MASGDHQVVNQQKGEMHLSEYSTLISEFGEIDEVENGAIWNTDEKIDTERPGGRKANNIWLATKEEANAYRAAPDGNKPPKFWKRTCI